MTMLSIATRQFRKAALSLSCRAAARRYDDQLQIIDQFRDRDRWAVVVFDALRYDVASDYFKDARPVWSAGRDTFEWGRRVWGGDHDVVYVSGAAPINSSAAIEFEENFQQLYGDYVPTDHIADIVDVWQSGWDSDLGTVPPEAITAAARDRVDEPRLIIHYYQPHTPHIGDIKNLGHTEGPSAKPLEGPPADAPIWKRVREGDLTRRQLRRGYRANFERALASFRDLVDELDRPMLITGDHGEALGDHGEFGHSRTPPHPAKRVVPVVVRE